MLKKINRVLKLLGLKLIRANHRKKALKWTSRLMTSTANPEWQPIPNDGNEGRTHFSGDGCWPPHQEFKPPTSDKK